jgi:sulfate adenylyltransferase
MTSGPTVDVHPSPQALGDAVLLSQGAYAPLDHFVCEHEGRRIRDRGQLLDGAAFPVAVSLVLPTDEIGRDRADDDREADAARAGSDTARANEPPRTLVLVDAEGAPVADVAVDSTWAAAEGLAVVSGPVAERGQTPHVFAALARPARDVHAEVAGRGARGLLVDRPLLAAEVSALAEIGEDGPLLLLVRSVDPAVPVDVLVKATLAAAEQIPGARVLTVPFARRTDPDDDEALGAVVLRNYGATPVQLPQQHAAWQTVLAALHQDDEAVLGDLVDAATLAVLRRWRPPRARRGLVVFFTGLSGSGKSTVARGLIDRLHETDRSVTVLDGDVARRMLSSGLGFSKADRDTNIRRLGWVGAEVARHGGLAVLAPIAPFAATRDEVRRMVRAVGDLVLVWVSTPLEECERRDRKGLYAKARRGEIGDFTGISSPYEEPDDADLVIDTTGRTVEGAVEEVWSYLVDGGWVSRDRAVRPVVADGGLAGR